MDAYKAEGLLGLCIFLVKVSSKFMKYADKKYKYEHVEKPILTYFLQVNMNCIILVLTMLFQYLSYIILYYSLSDEE